MSAVGTAFARCASEGRAAFVPFVVAGDPSLSRLDEILAALAAAGADAIELGFPYSDPLADGPTIQAAAQRALAGCATYERVVGAVRRIDRRAVPVPLIAFAYYNPLHARGPDRAAADLAGAGFAGTVVPDLPLEECAPLAAALGAAGIGLDLLVAPTTPDDRAARIAQRSSDFVYLVSRTGVTGKRDRLATDVADRVRRLRGRCAKPIAVGFGVSTAAHASAIARVADGVIVGSALVERIAAAPPGKEAAAAYELCSSLAAAVRGARAGAGAPA